MEKNGGQIQFPEVLKQTRDTKTMTMTQEGLGARMGCRQEILIVKAFIQSLLLLGESFLVHQKGVIGFIPKKSIKK